MNEEKGVGHVLANMPANGAMEIIVVDSSNDRTAEVARKFGTTVIRENRKGYGRALQTGIEEANGEVVVYIDADGTYDPKEIPKLVQPILDGKLDVVVGNRLHRNMNPSSMTAVNKLGNRMLSFVFRLVYKERISDSQCGLRAIKKEFIKSVRCCEWGMPYVTEQLIALSRAGAKIGEVQIGYRPRIGKTKLVPWKDGFKILGTIIRNL